jgi:hypothetical protein
MMKPLEPSPALNVHKLVVTKLDAARRQLETAISLYFHDGDPVSAHTLAAAARQVIEDLNTKSAGTPMMQDDPSIVPEYKKAVKKLFADAENFFKHAKRDPTDTHFFVPQLTEAFILDATEKYVELAHERRPLFDVFFYWMVFRQPQCFKKSFVDKLFQTMPANVLRGMGKREFFNILLPIFHRTSSAAVA